MESDGGKEKLERLVREGFFDIYYDLYEIGEGVGRCFGIEDFR